MKVFRTYLYLLLAMTCVALMGCDSDESVESSTDVGVGFPDATGNNPPTTPPPGSDTSSPSDASSSPPELPPVVVGKCEGTPGDKPIMSACSEHCECQTGYCYDENFLGGGFRFCSMDCANPSIGQCSKINHPDSPGVQKYGCLNLSSLKDDYDLETTSLCVLRCENLDECKQYSSQYDQCGNFSGGSWTMWDDHTIAGFGTCLISAEISPHLP